jgi:lipopolysaccharide/colanic/teichoic acid biosynthesis glycosyltransferase
MLNRYLDSNTKRTFDVVFSLSVLPLAIPLVCLSALLIKITSPGSAFFTQKRVGKNSKIFVIYKIRTIVQGNTNPKAGMFPGDASVLPVGYWLRALRIDELPQILNIFKGEMSWVGPRPEQLVFVEMECVKTPQFSDRHKALPGITGLAQIKMPNATPDDNGSKLVWDLDYLKRASLFLDLKILLKSFLVIWK